MEWKREIKQWFRDLKAVLRKDLISTKRVRKYFFSAVVPPIVLLVIFTTFLQISNPETYKVMVVDEDNTEFSELMSEYLTNITSEFAPWFEVERIESYEEARFKLENYDTLGLIYIAPGFGANVSSSDSDTKGSILLEVQNINHDYVKNYVQRVDEAILQFNQKVHISHGHVDNFELIAQKSYLIEQDVSHMKGIAIGAIGLYGIICGLLFGALNVAKEYDDSTMIEIINSPIKKTAYIASKQVIATLLGTIIIMVFSLVMIIFFQIQITGNIFTIALAFIMSTWIHACLGALIGLKVKDTMPVILIAIVLSIFIWFFAGGLAPTKVLGGTVYIISRFFPGTYWMEILQSEIFIPSPLYVLPRLGILTLLTIFITIISWTTISKWGFKL